jgi:flagellar protein FlaG
MGMEISGIPSTGAHTEYRIPQSGGRRVEVQNIPAEVPELNPNDIKVSMEILSRTYNSLFNKKLQYSVNKEINRVVVKIVDGETDKVIREIPPAEIQRLVARIRETLGLLFDEKI